MKWPTSARWGLNATFLTRFGGLGGVAGTLIGYELRTRLVKALKVPDFLIALLEDVVVVGGGLFLVSRF